MAGFDPRTVPGIPAGAFARVLTGAIIISFSAVFVKLAHVGPSASAFYRVFFGALGLTLLALARKERFRATTFIWAIIVGAAFFFAADLNCWHASIHYIGPGLSTILANFQVFFLAFVGAMFFREKVSLRLVAALPLAMGGLWLLLGISTEGLPEGTLMGVFLGLATAVFYTGYILTLRRSQGHKDKLPLVSNMACVSIASAVLCGLFAVLNGDSLAIPTVADGAYLLVYGLLCQGIGWLFLSSALPQLPAAVAGLLMLIQPTLSFVWDIVFFGRPTGPLGWIGAVMAIVAIWMGVSGQQAVNGTGQVGRTGRGQVAGSGK